MHKDIYCDLGIKESIPCSESEFRRAEAPSYTFYVPAYNLPAVGFPSSAKLTSSFHICLYARILVGFWSWLCFLDI